MNDKSCEMDERLPCIDCECCTDPGEIDVGEYVLALMETDIEKGKQGLEIFTVLTHVTREQELKAYKIIHKLRLAEKIRDEFKALMGLD